MAHEKARYYPEPLRSENSWRVRDGFTGSSVVFRVSEREAREIAFTMNRDCDPRDQP